MLRVRCPACQKLYSVDPKVIQVARPEFVCYECNQRFFFNYPVPNPNLEITGQLIQVHPPMSSVEDVSTQISPLAVSHNSAQTVPEAMEVALPQKVAKVTQKVEPDKQCPKCKRSSRGHEVECAFCGLVFSKVRRKQDGVVASVPSSKELQLSWQGVLEDYGNLARHEAFLQLCIQANHLPFASQQYKIMLQANPNDDQAHQMRKKIIEVATVTYIPTRQESVKPSKFNFVTITLFVAILLILTGSLMPHLRNLVGVGAMLIVTTVGWKVFANRQF